MWQEVRYVLRISVVPPTNTVQGGLFKRAPRSAMYVARSAARSTNFGGTTNKPPCPRTAAKLSILPRLNALCKIKKGLDPFHLLGPQAPCLLCKDEMRRKRQSFNFCCVAVEPTRWSAHSFRGSSTIQEALFGAF